MNKEIRLDHHSVEKRGENCCNGGRAGRFIDVFPVRSVRAAVFVDVLSGHVNVFGSVVDVIGVHMFCSFLHMHVLRSFLHCVGVWHQATVN